MNPIDNDIAARNDVHLRPKSQSTLTDHQERILRAITYIESHIREELTLEQVARVACFSPYHFHRIFTAHVGESLAAYIRRVRLDLAAMSLLNDNTSITRLAIDTGYDTPGAFTRAFQQKFQCSPSTFRENMRVLFRKPPHTFFSHQSDQEKIMQPEIRTVPERQVIFVRRIGDYNTSATQAWAAVCAFAFPRGLIGPHAQFIGVSHDDPQITAVEQLRFDACITIDRPVTPEGEIGVKSISGGKIAVFLHKGPYSTLHTTYQAIFGTWLPSCGYELADSPCYEVYLNSPEHTLPADLLTEICIPIQS
jgi:AraC family transcriptional regulator